MTPGAETGSSCGSRAGMSGPKRGCIGFAGVASSLGANNASPTERSGTIGGTSHQSKKVPLYLVFSTFLATMTILRQIGLVFPRLCERDCLTPVHGRA